MKRGSILLIALWSLFLLSCFAVILGTEVRSKIELVRRVDDRDTLRSLCDAGVRTAVEAVKGEEVRLYEVLSDPWANDPFRFGRITLGDNTVSIQHAGETGRPVYGLVDEESKININEAPPQVIERLLRVCGLEEGPAQELAYSIVDWRDADSFLSVPLGSAEDSYYRSQEVPYGCKNAPFDLPDEVLLVKGMDENVFQKIGRYITIYGDGKVNLNTAEKPVLIALGLSAETADLLIDYRNGKDGIPGTGDDGVLTSSALTSALSAVYRLSDAEMTELSAVENGGMAAVRSRFFTVTAVASMRGGRSTRTVTAVVDTKENILYWSER
ncbi:MAG: general secretion pathway protein GspK [Deltaproteobacteria bacterium]